MYQVHTLGIVYYWMDLVAYFESAIFKGSLHFCIYLLGFCGCKLVGVTMD